VQRLRAFTLIEIVLAVFILMLVLLVAVPSLNGVIADRRLKRSLDGFNDLVRQAQQRSITERRAYLVVWRKKSVVLRPETFTKGEEVKGNGGISTGSGRQHKAFIASGLVRQSSG